MKTTDYTNETPDFDNGLCRWYREKRLQKIINTEQAENLPELKDLGCFVVIGPDIKDLVLINDKQEVLQYYSYSFEGIGQMEAFINILKVSEHYKKHEEANL